MKSDQQLNISGVVIPFSLALCKSTLSRMAAGAVLEICLSDQDTLQDLLVIVQRSGEDILAWERHDDCYYLWVRKRGG
jgi:TusA-related sulfurtransferase